MYAKEKTVPFKSTASLMPNNLSRVRMDGKIYAGVIHKQELNVVCTANTGEEPRVVVARMASSAPAGVTIMQAAWTDVHGRAFLVLATTKGILVYDWDGSVLRHAHLLPMPPPDSPFSFTKGIAALYTGYICVGMHTGEVVMLRVSKNGNVNGTEIVRWHSRPITALASHGKMLVSGDDEGNLVVAQEEGTLSKTCSIDICESPVTCLAVWSGQVLAGFLSGHLKIFNMLNGRILAEVCAHARCITGLDVARDSGMVVTAGEDSFMRVWQLHPSRPDHPIEHVHSAVEENAALCGVAFTDDLGSGYIVASYDSKELICYAT
ncbi:WD repeat-containing protein 54-like [Portunus trituberculatus]|uniref:WD repeat-containing protein 54-like n=1 Tax=Portunus trituberculatus TaxID=210409 RepID=UPI001E1CD954|nr:WD repeat-containing protein 54-like [Portunus trituberculatus]